MKSYFTIGNSKQYILGLSISTALLLGFSFPPFPLGVLACVGFVPFLLLVENISSYWRFFRYSYITFFLFCVITLYWVGGFTHHKDPYLMLAGGGLLLWQPFFFTLPVSIYFTVRKSLNSHYAVVSFPFIWITFEWLYALSEFAFPWLTIGNTQTYQIEKIQFIEITGVYGISLWILLLNILIYFLLRAAINLESRRKQFALFSTIVVLYVAPNFYTLTVEEKKYLATYAKSFHVGVVQPNVDPWNKWEGADTFEGRWSQVQEYLQLIGRNINDSTDVIVLPESAILLNLPSFYQQYLEFKKIIDSLNIAVVSGYVKVKYYQQENAPASASAIAGTNIRYDSYNSILLVEPRIHSPQSYSKMRLVPFAERIPYAEQVPFLIEPLRWGVGISNWGKGTDSTIFYSQKINSKFLAMVCYESIFPEFVSSFVNKGAEFLVFITNDSWWGNTSGARQHYQYAVLRAIENRRWVVRCANGGISSFIDPCGNIYDKTDMYVRAYIQHKITPLQEKTYYTQHGDWLARICASIALIFFLFSVGYSFIKK